MSPLQGRRESTAEVPYQKITSPLRGGGTRSATERDGGVSYAALYEQAPLRGNTPLYADIYRRLFIMQSAVEMFVPMGTS